jgi:hypothetical protein
MEGGRKWKENRWRLWSDVACGGRLVVLMVVLVAVVVLVGAGGAGGCGGE